MKRENGGMVEGSKRKVGLLSEGRAVVVFAVNKTAPFDPEGNLNFETLNLRWEER